MGPGVHLNIVIQRPINVEFVFPKPRPRTLRLSGDDHCRSRARADDVLDLTASPPTSMPSCRRSAMVAVGWNFEGMLQLVSAWKALPAQQNQGFGLPKL